MTTRQAELAHCYMRFNVMSWENFEPLRLLLDETLTQEQKVWMLQQRILDLSAELRASEENMTSDSPGDAAERLREAQRTLRYLQADQPLEMVLQSN